MNHPHVVHIGIDVSKQKLDIDAAQLGATSIPNTPAQARKALAAIARKAKPDKTLHICFESTGPYTAALAAQCQALKLPYSILHPYKVKHFAIAIAHAKTDALDARLIRRYAEVKNPAPTTPTRKALVQLDKLVLARDALVKSAVALRATLETLKASPAAKPVERAIAQLQKQTAECDVLIAQTVKADEQTAALVAVLSTVKGVGTLTAAKVIANMPELGTLGRRKAAALAGLAPHTRESGTYKGKSRIGGGRKHVRDALFMPATVAIRHNPELKRLHAGLMAKGKPYKVALTAVMRRLLCHLESRAKDYYTKHGETRT
jgi:transposase